MDDASLLAVAYRGRPVTIGALATLSHVPIDDVRAAVRRLRGDGRLAGRGERIAYVHPVDWTAESISRRASALRHSASDLLQQIERMATDLPQISVDWAVGAASFDPTPMPMPVLTRHGPRAAEDLWYQIGYHDGGTLDAVLPDISRFLTSSPERIALASDTMRGKDAVRLIIPASAVEDPAAEAILAAFTAAGIEYRLLDEPPSWLWVDGDLLALPFAWGEGRPTSVMSVQNAALAAIVSAYFATLWRAATPPAPAAHPWSPLLAIMRQGITLETASRRLGVHPRTGRRRVAQAMQHYGVSTLFALGVAWSADPHAESGSASAVDR